MILLCSGGDQQWEYWFMTLFHSGGLPTRFGYADRLQNSKFVIARQWIHFTQCTDNKGLERIY